MVCSNANKTCCLLLTRLSNVKVFTKLDLGNGYWDVTMEEESSYLTTFITDHGRFRWFRLLFRLSVSAENFTPASSH